jgi:hypothetical protein
MKADIRPQGVTEKVKAKNMPLNGIGFPGN